MTHTSTPRHLAGPECWRVDLHNGPAPAAYRIQGPFPCHRSHLPTEPVCSGHGVEINTCQLHVIDAVESIIRVGAEPVILWSLVGLPEIDAVEPIPTFDLDSAHTARVVSL